MTSVVLFTGDSVTDCGRREDHDGHLGFGYVRNIAGSGWATGRRVVNTGIGGNRMVDLAARRQRDVLAHNADIVSVLIGVNDTWRRYDNNEFTSTESFENDYRRLLEPIVRAGSRLVLVEPFLLPVTAEQNAWREDLDPRIEVVRTLAAAYDAVLVPADVALARSAASLGATAITLDGVHPTSVGHELLASLWLETVTAAGLGPLRRA
ncbi:SGNH/GDSL hydrolase family protein [Cryobacterium sp. PH31-AA6]|uniref:SGNH/GDSL hydrolase family protein n=1 Tax=Cryobacterium sp. PH31-AA6 TaxID=3046205 RepID=UPI0024BB8CD8|nr:SGNH/GDSL hydrolase family protein [Cryobacterium sp. PH31-AA6]MDJ0323766.1 SGNH/GDSL hydrolase family protein [Cryobacterium sp. PH31-AA6]